MYNGTRNATIVENFLFGLEQYFEAIGVVDDLSRISNVVTFFRDATQLWWRRKHAERERGICVINSWEQFKAELRKHFVPHNVDIEARGKLRRLRQSGSISDYIKEFTTIMLEIEDLSDKDALFYFKDGLKDWAKTELDKRNVQTLDDAIAAAESFVDYSSKNKKPNLGKSGEDKSGLKKSHDLKDSENKKSFNGSTKQEKVFPPKKDTSKPPKPCFICEGPHWTRDCPNWKAINALVTEMREKEAKESQVDMRSLQHIGALSKIFSSINVEEKEAHSSSSLETQVAEETSRGLYCNIFA
ncbi:hypothetical protein L6164_026194 [Bauhinia variegata]|uniref:Uncharacterized protein n=1 Tax=Bauhinia variegata TaxID=167791 RepID=A0ACB9LQC0_BAUVA|nr:hypothetical protein L6164_026194 [Bauhinia variegata]